MSGGGGRGLALGLGILGAILIVLEGLVDAARGVVFLAFGHAGFAVGAWSQSVLFILLGFVLLVVVVYGRAARPDGSRAAGLVLVIIPLLGFVLFGFLAGILVLLGAVLVLAAGILYLTAGS
ncbi:MAG: hypothetical protein L3J92_01440 [Thermoplasmata archaeon]|nr:hypothetical protein [Thermoplasmata archaeon]